MLEALIRHEAASVHPRCCTLFAGFIAAFLFALGWIAACGGTIHRDGSRLDGSTPVASASAPGAGSDDAAAPDLDSGEAGSSSLPPLDGPALALAIANAHCDAVVGCCAPIMRGPSTDCVKNAIEKIGSLPGAYDAAVAARCARAIRTILPKCALTDDDLAALRRVCDFRSVGGGLGADIGEP